MRASRAAGLLVFTAVLVGACASDSSDDTVGVAPRAASEGPTGSGSLEPAYGSAVVDGDSGEWNLGADFFADMYEAGKPDKSVLSKLYLRYACETEVLYVLVLAESNWLIVNSADDNFVKLGNNQKLVDGSFGNDGVPPDFEYVPFDEGFSLGWEASVSLAPGSYDNLNVHTQVVPRATRSATSAVADRAIPIEIVCDASTTTTTEGGSTTTVAPTTTTTVAPTTTTTVAPTTPTTVVSTTTSTVVASTTTSTLGSSTTTSLPGSTTTTLDVGGTTIATSTTTTMATTTTGDVGGSTLPNTGLDTSAGPFPQPIWLSLLLTVFGSLLVRVVRDRD